MTHKTHFDFFILEKKTFYGFRFIENPPLETTRTVHTSKVSVLIKLQIFLHTIQFTLHLI